MVFTTFSTVMRLRCWCYTYVRQPRNGEELHEELWMLSECARDSARENFPHTVLIYWGFSRWINDQTSLCSPLCLGHRGSSGLKTRGFRGRGFSGFQKIGVFGVGVFRGWEKIGESPIFRGCRGPDCQPYYPPKYDIIYSIWIISYSFTPPSIFCRVPNRTEPKPKKTGFNRFFRKTDKPINRKTGFPEKPINR